MMLSSQNVVIVKIPFRSRVIAFSNNCLLLLFSWERVFLIGNSGTGEPSTLHHRQTISGEEMHAHTDYIYGKRWSWNFFFVPSCLFV